MKLVVREDSIELIAESPLENDVIQRWQKCHIWSNTSGVASRVPVPWHTHFGLGDIHSIGIRFDPKKEKKK